MGDPAKFDVDAIALRMYESELRNYQSQTGQFGHLINTAHSNVTSVSWGVVGLFTLEKYRETVGELTEFVRSAEAYVGGLGDRVSTAASTYERLDQAAMAALDAINKELEAIGRGHRALNNSGGGISIESHEHKSVFQGGALFKAPEAPEGPIGDFVDFCQDTYTELQEKDNNPESTAMAVGSVVVDGASFAYECMEAHHDIIANPFRFLVQMGLDFLLEIFSPLQDLMHLVSGDPEALESTSEHFHEIDKGLREMRADFEEVTRDRLAGWGGVAAQSAKERLTDFAVGLGGLAERAGSLNELLAISSIVMEVVYDLMKSIISELVMWLIGLWIPALSAAAVTFGASLAAAGAGTAIKAADTTVNALSWVQKLMLLLDKLKDVLIKIAFKLGKALFKIGAEAFRAGEREDSVGGGLSDEEFRQKFDQKRNQELDKTLEEERSQLGL